MKRDATPSAKTFARANRRQMPKAEVYLWQRFRRMRDNGIVIRRQHAIGPFIVDFACIKAKIIVEVDGQSHEGREDYDKEREAWLVSQGWEVIRLSNEATWKDPNSAADFVCQKIMVKLGMDI
ncbi:MAG: DUF559 domain-containing protein [Chthonomonas sp.]|nr:DUF559 domain-containing protein [Chthonomonas sp.]